MDEHIADEPRPDRHELIRRHNQTRVLEAVALATGPISRVALAGATGLSKPTINILVEDLIGTGLLREAGTRVRTLGRPASLVELNAEAGYVLALAFDGDSITSVIADLNGDIQATADIRLPKPERLMKGVGELIDQVLGMAGTPPNRIRSVCVSAPGIIEFGMARRTLAQNVPGLDDDALRTLLAGLFSSPVTIENDVNLAAVGESRFGSAAGSSTFVFLLVDTGVGMGFMLNGDLYRGSRGAAGEAGFLPLGSLDLAGRSARIGALETAAGLRGLLKSYRDEREFRGLQRTRPDLVALLGAVDLHEPAALAAIDREVDLVTRAVLAATVLIDPEFVVLAGCIGSSEPVIHRVREQLERIAPYPVEVRASSLHGRAAIMGAVASGLVTARSELGLPPS